VFSAFLSQLWHYTIEVIPALALGLFISGIIHEFMPEDLVKRYIGRSGLSPIFSATLVGIILPVCCWGSLPIAISFHKKGARLGPTLAFLIATPATSITAIFVSFKLLGFSFTLFLCISVIMLGLVVGLLGNLFYAKEELSNSACDECECKESEAISHSGFYRRSISVLKYAFFDMPRHIGLELLIGLILAAAVASIVPLGNLVQTNLSGLLGYPFSLGFGLIMYICATASVPLVNAFLVQGMNIGAGMVLLLVGPITSYGTILVIRKHFGLRVLLLYLSVVSFASLFFGGVFNVLDKL
jgi:hypothetical protein